MTSVLFSRGPSLPVLQSLFDKVEPNYPNFTKYEGKVNPFVLSAHDLGSRPVELNIEHINSSN